MSRMAYMITLSVNNKFKFSKKMKSKFGGYDGLTHEINEIDWEQYAKWMEEHYGGRDNMIEEWLQAVAESFK